MTEYAATLDDVLSAAQRIAGRTHRTPVITCASLDRSAGRSLFFKCENLQRGGSFKLRGAWNSVAKLSDEEAGRGVVTHSSGNHAQALALAARFRGIKAQIVMPEDSSPVKRRAVEGYGGVVTPCAPTLPAREEMAQKVLEKTGGRFIHPYDAPDTIAGQGTAALELLEEVGDLDAIVPPVGGGGLLAGTCITAKGLNRSIRIFGAEPVGADDAARSLAAGERILQTDPITIADGLRTSLGELTWPILRDHLDAIETVREEEIVAAMRLFWERTKLLIEPSSAVAVAVILSGRFPARRPARVGVILSGGNVDLDRLPWARSAF